MITSSSKIPGIEVTLDGRNGLESPVSSIATEQQWQEIQRIALHGQMAASAAHEICNLLTIVLLNAGLLKERHQNDEDELKCILPMLHAASLISNVCGQMRNAARISPVAVAKVVNLTESIQAALPLLTHIVPRKLTLDVIQQGSLPVYADPGHLDQILINLVLNARDATNEDTGMIQIRVGRDAQAPGDWRYIEIKDNGTGMPQHVKDSLFKTCITTKPRGRGTGLGLMTVGWLVSGMGGKITISSAPDHGTTVRILLPKPDNSNRNSNSHGEDAWAIPPTPVQE